MAPSQRSSARHKSSPSKGNKAALAYAGERLLITGYFNKWSTTDPSSRFDRVALDDALAGTLPGEFLERGAEVAPPAWRLTLHLLDGCLSFQVLSSVHLFDFRVFPVEVGDSGFSQLVRGEPSAVAAGVGGHKEGHGRNFFVDEPAGTAISVYAEVAVGHSAGADTAGRGVVVWYAVERSAAALQRAVPVAQESGQQSSAIPCRLFVESEIERVRSMLDELLEEFSADLFQKELRGAWQAGQGSRQNEAARREVCLKYQLPVVTKYGFEASFRGVLQAYCGFPWYDFEIYYKNLLVKWLTDPGAQAQGSPCTATVAAVPELASAVAECKRKIERCVGRAPALPAPLRGGSAAAAEARLVHVNLPWVENTSTPAPLLCAVVENLLAPQEVEALKRWIGMRCRWKPSNGHLICRINDTVLTRELWFRLQAFLPDVFESRRIAGLSEHLRFLKYGPGHHFLPHEDSMQTASDSKGGPCRRSLLSVLLYLSEPEGAEAGGGTRFVAPNCPACARSGRCDGPCEHCIDAPVRRGSLLLFAQSIMHAGTEPRRAEKLAVRSDVMYFDPP